MSGKSSGPSTAWLALTEACNNRCSWCYEIENSYLSSARVGASAKNLTLTELERAIPTLIQCGLRRAILIGGEPTLNPQFLAIVEYVAASQLDSTLVTNGRSASNASVARAYFDHGLTQATVSLHGWSEETYEGGAAKPQNFRQALAGFHNLRAAGIRVGATMVLGAHTLKSVSQIVNFLLANDIRQVQFNIAAPAVSPTGVDASFTAPMHEMAKHVVDVFKQCGCNGILSSFQLNLPFCLFEATELEPMIAAGAIKQSCHVIHGGGIVVRPGLRAAVCTHLMEFVVNNDSGPGVYETADRFLEFWRSQELEEERRNANAYRRLQCETCPKWNECGGGCMVHWSYYDPKTFEPAFRGGSRASWTTKTTGATT